MKKAFLVQALGYWGRGPTLKEAAQQISSAGLPRTSLVIVDLVMGDDKPEVVNHGMNIRHDKDAQIIRIGTGFKLGVILQLKTEENHDN